ncbi:MAG: GNAT family N-acetyltransferase [Candidatus Altiarchaeota archaeon]|nr:GNAT family N-acetyltransferase [Candidatus Altiarchaeota archaeon]
MSVTFRRVSEKDLKKLNEIVNDSEVCRYLSLIPPVSMSSTKKAFERFRKAGDLWYCIMVDGAVAGAVLLKTTPKGLKNSHVASVGIDIDKPYWGKGVGGQALEFIIKKAGEKGVKRLEIEYMEGNTRAEKLYTRIGFIHEGRRKKAIKAGSKYYDSITMYMWLR